MCEYKHILDANHEIKIYKNSSRYAVKHRLYHSKAHNYTCKLKNKRRNRRQLHKLNGTNCKLLLCTAYLTNISV